MTPASVDAPKPKRLLFVCLGNICRSPAAHAVMEAMVAEAGLNDQIEVDSCGVGDWHVGQLPDSRMRRHGARRGYRVDHHARQFSAADFDRFDYIIVMDEGNYRAISAKARTQAQADALLTADCQRFADAHRHILRTDLYLRLKEEKEKGRHLSPKRNQRRGHRRALQVPVIRICKNFPPSIGWGILLNIFLSSL